MTITLLLAAYWVPLTAITVGNGSVVDRLGYGAVWTVAYLTVGIAWILFLGEVYERRERRR